MINAKLLQFRSCYYFILLVVIGQFKYHLIITTLRSELDLTMCQVYVFFLAVQCGSEQQEPSVTTCRYDRVNLSI